MANQSIVPSYLFIRDLRVHKLMKYMLKFLGKVDCVTVSGDKHKPCVFPVLWKGEYRDECIEQGSTGKHWCATELKSTGAYSKFGHCSDSCPREGKRQISIRVF